MTAKEENYIHYTECCLGLNSAWRILKELQGIEKRTGIHYAAYCFALIEYAQPYTRSDGTHKKYSIPSPPPQLSPEELKLHEQIIRLRHKVLAHSDLTLKDAKMSIFSYGGSPHAMIAQNHLPQFPEINAVVSLIEHTLDAMYVTQSRMLDDLVANVAN
ncbi:hypothetical protein [Pedosphaera parvula]|uniref:HEPN AbiU2-like domain-containing protein n=1 Tax=Pedosphaera parvula (strain Ellin514) TaxID=320771 RepID=B9XJN6_PEDPL|nr:hypothetical protein [Pedosphaera parvula]EEF59912.1 hypothetical protein Cflav_PD2716 [Pedosphaera parvula Ellin514]